MSGPFDVVIRNASPWTDGARVRGADALAIAGGRIAALGSGRELLAGLRPGGAELDARGATVTPGCTDAHLHLLAWARARAELALHDAGSAAECASRVARRRAEAPGSVIRGRGWDSNEWPDRPSRALLDAASPGTPVLLHSKDFHALWVNGAAFEAAGVSERVADPPGGRFERDAAGALTGVVREHAVRAFAPLLGAAPLADDGLFAACAELHAAGVTAVHDFEDAESLRRLPAIAAEARGVRVLANLPHARLDEALALGVASGVGDDRFRLGAVKLFADGTLGSRTAAMLAPYDGSDERGLELLVPEALNRDVARALAGGIAVAVHAIGDRATRNVLDAFAGARDALRVPRLPSRIEHLQLVHPEDAPRLAALGLVASMQPAHCTADIAIAERHWGSRREHAYAWRRFERLGVPLAFGSDAPVEPPSVAEGLASALTRERADGTPAGGWVPGERLDLDRALAAYTEAPARVAGSWPRLGTLRAGARADVVVWSADLFALDPRELRGVHAAFTLLDGAIVGSR